MDFVWLNRSHSGIQIFNIVSFNQGILKILTSPTEWAHIFERVSSKMRNRLELYYCFIKGHEKQYLLQLYMYIFSSQNICKKWVL